MTETFWGILIPFLGTSLGAACVFFMRRALGDLVQRSLAGFAAGVMVAASVWSLLIPAIEQSEKLGRFNDAFDKLCPFVRVTGQQLLMLQILLMNYGV